MSVEEVEALFSEVFEAAAVGRRSGTEIAAAVGQTQARWQTLWTLGTGSLTVPQIARRLGQTRQNIQRLANELAEERLVDFADNPDHKRSPLVSLTERGRSVLDDINSAGATFNGAVLTELGADRVQELRVLLRDFTAAVKANLTDST